MARSAAVVGPVLALLAMGLTANPARADGDDRRRSYARVDYGGHYHHGSHGRAGFSVGVHFTHVHGRPAHSNCRYVPACYETRTEQVCVSHAHTERRWVHERVVVKRDHHGRTVRVIKPGYWETIHVPARYETRTYRVHVPARWVCDSGCSGHHRH